MRIIHRRVFHERVQLLWLETSEEYQILPFLCVIILLYYGAMKMKTTLFFSGTVLCIQIILAITFSCGNVIVLLLEPLVVAYVQTTYTVTESEGQVEVCVNLTHSEIDLLGETVRVEVFNDRTYIPPNAILASESPLYACACSVTRCFTFISSRLS